MIEDEIRMLRNNHRAVILAHNYCRGEVQDIADFTGDSLELARKATEIDADVIVFCGVKFMAEQLIPLCRMCPVCLGYRPRHYHQLRR